MPLRTVHRKNEPSLKPSEITFARAREREGQLVRVAEETRSPVNFFIDGVRVSALVGDTVVTAILTQQRHLRRADFSDTFRAGFCLIGACQDCWVMCENGKKVRGCSTLIEDAMRLVTGLVPVTEETKNE
ncbi:(2Fe-2S)-binding protein [Caballeronia sp. dw_19]|uniref:(2Fe-2S)-binding protein n=1 Tax=Caballeronia sp. dw_19 TaxID=2719791 RepID=UPI001BCEB8C6|nr:(2Fe-2S)-binding protein [Caballeronia sp. dw_19]